MKPISPNEVALARPIPDEVIKAFNDMIVRKWSGNSATIMQKEMASKIAEVLNISISEVYNQRYLDIEPLFRHHGWDVYYDKPAYNETYEASFRFSAKKSDK